MRRRPHSGAVRTGASWFSEFRRSARCTRRSPSPSHAARSSVQLLTDESRVRPVSRTKHRPRVLRDLIDVTPVGTEDGKVAQYGSATAQGQWLGEGGGEEIFREVGTAQLEIAGPPFFGEAGTVEVESAAVVGVAVEGGTFSASSRARAHRRYHPWPRTPGDAGRRLCTPGPYYGRRVRRTSSGAEGLRHLVRRMRRHTGGGGRVRRHPSESVLESVQNQDSIWVR